MVIFVNPNGETMVSNSIIGRGSRLSRVNVISPTRAGAAVELLLEPPNGMYLPPMICAPSFQGGTEPIGVYSTLLDKSVTLTPGTVKYQVRFTYANRETEVTAAGTFTIANGVEVVPPDDPEYSLYDEIMDAIAEVNANYGEIYMHLQKNLDNNQLVLNELRAAVTNAAGSADRAEVHANEAQERAVAASDSAFYAAERAKAAENAQVVARDFALNARQYENSAAQYAGDAKASRDEAAQIVEAAKGYLSQIPRFGTKKVDALPTEDISATTVYLIREGEESFDLFTEYLFIPDNTDTLKLKYSDSEGHWETVGGRAGDSGRAPSFDLYALGLPNMALTGEEVIAGASGADIIEAAERGAVILSLMIDGYYRTFTMSAEIGAGAVVFSKDIDPYHNVTVTVTADTIVAKAVSLDARFKDIEREIADILYKEISVSSFTTSVATAEIGSTVNDVTLTWKLNKKPVSVTIDGAAQEAAAEGSVKKTGLGLTANKTWTIRAVDERGAAATKSTSVSFYNGVYYGVGGAQSSYTSLFILGLTKTLRPNKLASFTANAGAGQYIYYCLPVRYGKCTFAVGGFTGGFTLDGTVSFTNASGYTEDYYVYKSDNAGLGATTVSVS